MSENLQIKLDASSALTIPFNIFEKDFTFIVNGEEFKTNRLIANFLSPRISQNLINDPTISQFTIHTQNKGNFQHFLNLINFQKIKFPSKDIPFIEEVVKILENTSLTFFQPQKSIQITKETVFDQINDHLIYPIVNSELIQTEIDLIASIFYEMNHDDLVRRLKMIQIDVLEKILQSPKLKLESEDQLISIINELYLNDPNFYVLYEYIDFINVSEVKMSEFLEYFNIDDMTSSIWKRISNRLLKKVFSFESTSEGRYNNQSNVKSGIVVDIPYREDRIFDGIIRFIMRNLKSEANSRKIEITSSEFEQNYEPRNAILYDDPNRSFATSGENAFICFNFKNYRVIPKSYTIRSWNTCKNASHPRGWVIEGSNDNNEFEVIDEQRDCPFLNEASVVHTFHINNQYNKDYKYIRMRTTMKDWFNGYDLDIDAIEFNGGLML